MADIKSLTRFLINSGKVMTLATPWKEGAWSAPVYYLYANKCFYFFSAPDSRHILGAENGRAGASIFEDSESFRDIRGIQMRGKIEKVSGNKEAALAALKYMKRFGITYDGKAPLKFIKENYRALFFRFVPEKILYMDNRVKIGFKKEVISFFI